MFVTVYSYTTVMHQRRLAIAGICVLFVQVCKNETS